MIDIFSVGVGIGLLIAIVIGVLWFSVPFVGTVLLGRLIRNSKKRFSAKIVFWVAMGYLWIFVGMLLFYSAFSPQSWTIGAFDAAVKFCTDLGVLWVLVPVWLVGAAFLVSGRFDGLLRARKSS